MTTQTKRNMMLGLWIAQGLLCLGATNTASRTDFSSFAVVGDRNIFNPNRYPHSRSFGLQSGVSSGPSMRCFTFVGMLGYEKGLFAFFSSANPDYQKAVTCLDEIAGFKLESIQPDCVALASGANRLEIKIGEQMRQKADGGWEVVQPPQLAEQTADSSNLPPEQVVGNLGDRVGEQRGQNAVGWAGGVQMRQRVGFQPAQSTESLTASSNSPPKQAVGNASDILRKLMKRREQELQ